MELSVGQGYELFMSRYTHFTAAGSCLAALVLSSTAQAHIRLLEPTPRYDIVGFDTGIKSCPCGLGSSNRTCNVAVDASDPDRGTRVSRFEAGSTITLRFDEYVDHSGTYRVAFDPDGADIADFNANILVPMVPDPSGGMGNVNEGSIWEIEVELPDMTCSNCTLQLVQAMNNNTTTPVPDPSSVSSYYTCVDIELVAPGTLGDDDSMDPDDGMEPDDGMQDEPTMTGSGTQGTMGGAVQPADMSGMVANNTGSDNTMAGPATMGSSTDDDPSSGPYGSPSIPGMGMTSSGSAGGCSLGPVRAGSAHGSAFALSSLALALGVLGRRRARARG